MPLLNLSKKKFFPLKCAVVSLGLCVSLATAGAQTNEDETEDLSAAIEQARNYCEAIADQAKDTRIAWQMRALFDVERQMTSKISELDAKIAELRSWVKRRDDILRRAEGHVLISMPICARMPLHSSSPRWMTKPQSQFSCR